MSGIPPCRLVLIGGDSEAFNRFLESDDPCFGRSFAASAPECKNCTAAVIADGQIFLLNEVCRDRTQAAKAERPVPKSARINRMSAQEVMRRLEVGRTAEQIFFEVLGQADIEMAGSEARQYLYGVLHYLKQTYKLPVPGLPRLRALKEARK